MARLAFLHSADGGATAILLAGALLGAGCASNPQAEWTDPQFQGRSLKGTKVLVACDAAEVALQRICEDQTASRLREAGVTPLRAADAGLAAGAAKPDDQVLDAARKAGAAAIFTSKIAPDATVASPRPSIGIGIGGFGGYHSGVGAGVGVSVPVGEGQVSTAFGASMSLIDTATGKPMWSSRATAAASKDVAAQIGKLTDQGIRSAQKAGLL
jgi:hypothetical protein